MTLERFLAWADRRNLIAVRTTVLGVTVWMTWRITEWAFALANAWLTSGHSGVEAAAVIAAVTVPFTTLQAWAFKLYLDSKGN